MSLVYNPDPASVRSGMLRSAGHVPPFFSVLPRTDDWFVKLANRLSVFRFADGLSDEAFREVVAEAVAELHVAGAATVFALIAPHRTITKVAARDLLTHAKRATAAELPEFCSKVIALWRKQPTDHDNDR